MMKMMLGFCCSCLSFSDLQEPKNTEAMAEQPIIPAKMPVDFKNFLVVFIEAIGYHLIG
jgi:hypothetical protein